MTGISRARGYKIMTTPNEARRTNPTDRSWGDTQAADVTFTVVPILCCRRRSASARPVRQLSLQAGSRPRNCGRFVPGGVSELECAP